MQEPRDGDFVAYIDALQRESAARLAREHVIVHDSGFPSGTAASLPGNEPVLPSRPAGSQTATSGPVRDGRGLNARLFKALVAAVIGIASLLSWIGGRGVFSLIIGVALLVYAAPRLLALYREQSRGTESRTAIDHVFGRSGRPTTGTRR